VAWNQNAVHAAAGCLKKWNDLSPFFLFGFVAFL